MSTSRINRIAPLLAGAALAAAAAAPALAVPPDFAERADAYVERAWPGDGPGAAVIVTDDGEIVYARGRGLADIEEGIPITPETVFRMGSITKQFSAAVLLQLVQEGRISLDDPLSKFIPDYPEPGASATVRQLLNHTVGIQSYTGIPGWMVEENTARPHTTEEMIAHFRDLPAPSRPGEAWAYNNSGYVLVGAVIEAVIGKPWHEAVRERLAAPLGLATIRYGDREETIPNMAMGYTAGEEGVRPAQRLHMSVPHAAGGLVGSVTDLARWAQALHGGQVLGPELYAAMIEPTTLPNGETVPYGFGMGSEEVRGRPGIGHSGGIFGFLTDSVYIPEEDIFVAVFTNSDEPETGPGIALQRIAAMALGDPHPVFEAVPADIAALEPLFGVYRIDGGEAERRFYERDGKLYTQRSGASETEVFAAGDGRFFYGPNSLTWFRLAADAAGTAVMEMHQNGAEAAERAVRTGPIPPAPAAADVPRETLERYVGAYRLPQATATIAWDDDGGLTVQLTGQPALPLRAVSTTEFHVDRVGARVLFEDSGEGETASGIVIHHGGQEIEGERVPAGS